MYIYNERNLVDFSKRTKIEKNAERNLHKPQICSHSAKNQLCNDLPAILFECYDLAWNWRQKATKDIRRGKCNRLNKKKY